MGKVVFIVVFVVLAGAVGAGFLVTWNMPAPATSQEKIIPNDRF